MDCLCMERPKEAGGRGLAKNLLGMTSFDVASHDFETDPGEALRQKCVDMTTKLWLECEKMIASLGDARSSELRFAIEITEPRACADQEQREPRPRRTVARGGGQQRGGRGRTNRHELRHGVHCLLCPDYAQHRLAQPGHQEGPKDDT